MHRIGCAAGIGTSSARDRRRFPRGLMSHPALADGNGAKILDTVLEFLGRFVAYPDEHAPIAHTLWIAHAHLMNEWESTPRLSFLSPEPGSGKTRALEITETLVPRPIASVNATP